MVQKLQTSPVVKNVTKIDKITQNALSNNQMTFQKVKEKPQTGHNQGASIMKLSQHYSLSCLLSATHGGLLLQELASDVKVPPSIKPLLSLLLTQDFIFGLEAGKYKVYQPVECRPTIDYNRKRHSIEANGEASGVLINLALALSEDCL